MSHEGERPIDARIQDRPERAPPHWLKPLGWAVVALLVARTSVFVPTGGLDEGGVGPPLARGKGPDLGGTHQL
jgi:hypothetical protein